MPFVRLAQGSALHYAERGEGQAPVLLVHGAGASSAIWTMVTARLARASRVVAIDLPGHGESAAREGGRTAPSLQGYRDAVGALARALGLGPSIVVGHSMGALVAIEAALAWPDQVRGLVLCAAAPRLPVREELLALIRADPARVPAWMAEQALSPRAKPAVRRGLVAAGLVTAPEVMLEDFEAVRATDLTERVHGARCPLIWLDGADDVIVGPPGERPGEARRLEGVGHLVPLEAPAAVTAAVAALGTR
jgi:pimeloyl-ACP methyl ester carboxylesterase